MKSLYSKFSQRGDTIIEVLLSMAVLAIVASAAYATSTRSLHAGLTAQEREQALSLAQQQVETIKSADAAGTISSLKSSNPTITSGIYTIRRTYDNTTKTFSVNVSWSSIENRPQQASVFYRPTGSYGP